MTKLSYLQDKIEMLELKDQGPQTSIMSNRTSPKSELGLFHGVHELISP